MSFFFSIILNRFFAILHPFSSRDLKSTIFFTFCFQRFVFRCSLLSSPQRFFSTILCLLFSKHTRYFSLYTLMQRSCSTFLSPQFSSDLFILKSLFLQFFQHYSLKILVSIFVYLLCSINLVFFSPTLNPQRHT
jgi:hypothetical protein